MEILSQTQLLITNFEGFRLNSDLFETNIINQIILIPIVFYAYSSIGIDTTLTIRKNTIVEKIEDSEKRLIDATSRLIETKKQLEQAYLIFEEIQKETKLIKNDFLNVDYLETKNELIRRFIITTKNLKNKERIIFLEIKENISLLVMNEVINSLMIDKFLYRNTSIINTFMEKSIQKLIKLNKN
jgi:F-type H+-transporting ATPase subunit b